VPAASTRLTISRRHWRRLMRDLAARGHGIRESGAFLLARPDEAPPKVRSWVLFDEIDPDCLNGAVSIRGQAFTRLWAICRERGLRVVADVHTHGGPSVAQSSIDAANPMIAQRGHVALIAPNFARRRPRPQEVGLHIYRGDHEWDAVYGADAAALLRLTWW
jgi:proteasome lid subunit RPN8/RPN11